MDVIDPRIRSAVQAEGGRVTLARFMELALTAPDAGYYVRDHRILGEGGDFTTVPREVPAFNRSLALFMAELIDTMGQDSRLTVVEVGAGEGDMAQGVLGSWEEDRPELKDTIRYRLVDVGEGLVRRQRERLKPFTEAGWDVAWWSSLDPNESEIAGDGGRAIVVSNEFLDALPTHLLRVSGEQVEEQWIVSDQAGGGSSAAPDLREEWSTLSTPARAELDLLFGTTSAARLAPLSSDGFMEVRPGVGVFLQRIRHVFAESCVITFDYGDWLAGATEDIREGGKVVTHGRSLRTYSHHQSDGNILSYAGKRDITADVDFRAVHLHGEAVGFEQVLYAPLAAFLRGTGVEVPSWKRRGCLPQSLEADREACVLEALLDPTDVGGLFKVLVQAT